MKIIITVCALVFANMAQADEADIGRYVVAVNTKTLYIYDDAGEEIGELKADILRGEFQPISNNEQKGVPILQEDAEEGLVQVSIAKYPEPVWIENMAVEIWPGNRLKCPEVTTGRPEIEQSGMTIGFGEHCTESESPEE